MLVHYVFHVWFKIARPIKRKYKLSTNTLLVLNAAYIYNKDINKTFARTQLLKFASYYNNHKIGCYITVLVSHGYIVVSGKYKQHDLYSISPLGEIVINELNQSYNKELNDYCLLYGISL